MRLNSHHRPAPSWRASARRLSGYFAVLSALLLAIFAPYAHAAAACNVVYTISPQNTSAFGAAITIQNTGTTSWASWKLTWTFANGQTVSQLWNGIETQSGANVSVTNESYNGSIAAGASYTGIGFNGTWNGTTNAVPTSFAVNGVTCGAALTATTTTLAASTTTPTVGASVTLTATVSPAAATGTVTFYSGTTSLGTGTLSSGKATLTTSFATAGTYSLTAVYAGSTTYATSTSSAVTVTVSAATKTATTAVLAASTTTPAVGASVTLIATVSPSAATGTVTFFSGTTSLGTGTLSSGKATLTTSFSTAGTYSLTAVYAGSTTYATSTSSAVTVTVSAATKTATTTALAASTTTPTVGASVTLTATVSPSAATGTVTFFSGTTSLGTGTLSSGVATLATSFSTAGTDSLTAVYAGSTAYATSASSAVSVTVSATTGSFTLSSSPGTLSIAQNSSTTSTITITDVSPFSGSVTLAASGLPSGVTASFTVNPATTSSVVTFAVSGTAAVGTSTVTITGTSGSLTASTPISLTVTAAASTGSMACTIVYATTSQSSSAFGGTIAIDNTGTANWGSWTLTWTWANGQGISDIWNGIYSQSGGNVTITNESYNGSIAAGSSYSGMGFDGTWNGVTNTAPTNFAINGTTCVNGGSGFTLLASAPSLALNEGSSSTDTITVKDFGGFSGNVTLAAASLPSGITAAFGTNPTTGSSAVTFTAAATVLSGTYTVTITGTSGDTTATTTIALTVSGTTDVTVNSTSTGIDISDTLLGMNMAAWYDVVANDTAIVDAFKTAGIKAIRWPGGSWADIYHWATNSNCFESSDGTPAANNTFVNFVNDLAVPAGLDVALTADYGTDAACTGPGQPSEAAAWVAAALTDGITVSHMTVGNEVYGSWEEDLHAEKNNAATYASSVIGSAGFYEAIKAASPNTLVGVVVDADNTVGGWDNTVLSNAKGYYDFVEYHNYPQAPGDENDTTLVQQDAQELTTDIDIIKSELSEWGTAGTPIYVGEMGSVYTNPGKQSWSISQGLFAGQELGEMMNDGVSRATWWIGFGNCNGTAGNMSASLFGWQDFGGYNVFSGGPDDPTGTCPDAGGIGTLNPTAVAFELFSNVAVTGEHVLKASVNGDTTDVVAYAATHSGGTALMLFNRNETASEIVSIAVPGQTTASSVTEITYSEAIYDLSGSPTGTFPDPAGTNTWAPPTTTTISSPTLPLVLTLAPWSMNVVIIP